MQLHQKLLVQEARSWVQYPAKLLTLSCVKRIQQHGVFGVHKPLETKANSV